MIARTLPQVEEEEEIFGPDQQPIARRIAYFRRESVKCCTTIQIEMEDQEFHDHPGLLVLVLARSMDCSCSRADYCTLGYKDHKRRNCCQCKD